MPGPAKVYKLMLLEEKEEEGEEQEKDKEGKNRRARWGGEGKREGIHPWLRLCKVVICYSPDHKVTGLGVKSYGF